MEDNKLTEFEESLVEFVQEYFDTKINFKLNFIKRLRQIMPPTCTPNERKFMDEIREKGEWWNVLDCLRIKLQKEDGKNSSNLFQRDFEANLSELVEGRK